MSRKLLSLYCLSTTLMDLQYNPFVTYSALGVCLKQTVSTDELGTFCRKIQSRKLSISRVSIPRSRQNLACCNGEND